MIPKIMVDSAPDFGDGPTPKRYPNTKPKPAASLIIADISAKSPCFLMGQRSNAHVFMPGFFVFPGGRLERQDYNGTASLSSNDCARIGTKPVLGTALLACALRETREETGLDFTNHDSPIRYIGRAITPPGQIRRYDTRFFLAIADKASLPQPSTKDNELLSVDWFAPKSIPSDRIHRITGLVLEAVLARLSDDPTLSKDIKTPTYRFRYGKPVIEWE